MDKILDGIMARVTGPMSFRFILQPLMMIILGIKDGLADAKAGSPPFIFDLVFNPEGRPRDFKNAFKSLVKPIIFATVLDLVAQYLIFKEVRHPAVRLVPALVVGTLVMGVPYSIARGLSNRIATRRGYGKKPDNAPK